MPAKSDKQRAFIYATKGEDWAKKHHFDNKGKLPEKVDPKVAKRRAKGKKPNSFAKKG
jgi:hypothetical protein